MISLWAGGKEQNRKNYFLPIYDFHIFIEKIEYQLLSFIL